ncbi:hypothetical protein OSTOST_20123 [Ostertagia ostertagi]
MMISQEMNIAGMRKEMYRPDAPSYMQPFAYRLTQYCPARNDVDIGAGQRVGLLTKIQAILIASFLSYNNKSIAFRSNTEPALRYKVGYDKAELYVLSQEPVRRSQRGPCVVPRPKDAEEFKRRVWAYKRLLNRNRARRM